MTKYCKECGKELTRRNAKLYCKPCAGIVRRRQVVIRVTNKRKEIKTKAIQYLGGACSVCGYDRCESALEFHHKDPNEKDFGIARKGHTRAWSRIQAELDKCILVCANCHREIHSSVTQWSECPVVTRVVAGSNPAA